MPAELVGGGTLHVELSAVAGRIASAELELECKGHEPTDCRTAVKRATRYARRMAGHLPASIQPLAFTALLDRELAGAEAWLAGVEEARRRGDYARGMERAIRDDRWREGVERFTGESAAGAASRFAQGKGAAVAGWERRE